MVPSDYLNHLWYAPEISFMGIAPDANSEIGFEKFTFEINFKGLRGQWVNVLQSLFNKTLEQMIFWLYTTMGGTRSTELLVPLSLSRVRVHVCLYWGKNWSPVPASDLPLQTETLRYNVPLVETSSRCISLRADVELQFTLHYLFRQSLRVLVSWSRQAS